MTQLENEQDADFFKDGFINDMTNADEDLPLDAKEPTAKLISIMQKNNIKSISISGLGGGDSGSFDDISILDKEGNEMDLLGIDDITDIGDKLSVAANWYDNAGGKFEMLAKLSDSQFLLDRNWKAFVDKKSEVDEFQTAEVINIFDNLIKSLPTDVTDKLKKHLENSGAAPLQFKKQLYQGEISDYQVAVEGNESLSDLLESTISSLDEGSIEECIDHYDQGFTGAVVIDLCLDDSGEFKAAYSDDSDAFTLVEELKELDDIQNNVALDNPELVAMLAKINAIETAKPINKKELGL